MRVFLVCLVATVLSSATAHAADFASRYSVMGTNPGGSGSYTGSVTIKQTSEAIYQVVWTVDGAKFVGTGIGSPSGLAVSYKSGSDTGIAIYREKANGDLEGFWTYAGGKEIGRETWSPK